MDLNFFLTKLLFSRELTFDVNLTVGGATMEIFEAEVRKNAFQTCKLYFHLFIAVQVYVRWFTRFI